MYAIIETGGKQYRVSEGDTVKIENIESSDPVTFENYNFILKRRDLFFVNKNWESKSLGIFHRIGRPV